ncbi:MAG: ATP-dependent DNA helicase [Candidatus Yanofskybacteria bacterium GW2011_GWA1_41_6]|uniref:DNA 3'-5' helicase n=1 Tax=Candidatus Yanofskybacteria bacterium GW2011_GWA1_41_6 TaxID=1619020 RepID=A0A0G0WJ86_9BACT|nr:MAG: ATP-dependent DNA helicase [Candidatus Yanofskybacteria bacterium GW2011_GWA1_41_6]
MVFFQLKIGAYGETVSRVHGMDEVGARLPVGPQSVRKMEEIFKSLNERQVEAVKAIDGPVLVISGPGSGKTRCLTHRVAYLISQGIRPGSILAITFTNKASNEMRERIDKLLKMKSVQPTIGTFHSICLRILRKEIPLLGYKSNFSIFDTNDQLSLIKRVMANLEIDSKKYNPHLILNKISKLKTDLIFPENYNPTEFFTKIVSRVYNNYQSELKKMNGLDFDDLIVLTVKIFKQNPDILEIYQNFWKYILVDEYQDTSHDQYTLVNLLSAKSRNIFAIGDDAQSIYAFRDADIRNILNFQKDYPDAKIIFLEQNYRSTKTILAAAQNIISNNQTQVPKELWTENIKGEKIHVKETLNERAEAEFIVDKMDGLMESEYKIQDFTILYRTHAQSRAIEEALITRGFPYQIVGGVRFYERKEIKDILSYLKFMVNPTDLISFERIYNVPTRGIGETTFNKITAINGENLIQSIGVLVKEKGDTKQAKSLTEFKKLLTDLTEFLGGLKHRQETTPRNKKDDKNLTSVIKYVIKRVGYEDYLKNLVARKELYDNTEDRMENLKELLTVARKYNMLRGKEGIERFLEEISLLQETDNLKNASNRVTLMTIHSSKGLEFPIVFIAGMEEGLFPHSRATLAPLELEEERRLCYVAITRAKDRLIMTHAKYRTIFGTTQSNLPSRFIQEMPQDVLQIQPLFVDNYFEDDVIKY